MEFLEQQAHQEMIREVDLETISYELSVAGLCVFAQKEAEGIGYLSTCQELERKGRIQTKGWTLSGS